MVPANNSRKPDPTSLNATKQSLRGTKTFLQPLGVLCVVDTVKGRKMACCPESVQWSGRGRALSRWQSISAAID